MSTARPNRPPMTAMTLPSLDGADSHNRAPHRPESTPLDSDASRMRERFETTYKAEFDWVLRTVMRLGVRERDVEDLVHDVFIAFYRTMDGFDVDRPLRPWLFGVAFRVVSDYRRRASFQREQPDAQGADLRTSHAPSPHDSLERNERRRLVLLALEELPLDQRAVFIGVELDETPVPELASALQIPLNTCYSRLRLARARFAAAIERLADRPRPTEGGPR